LLLAHIQKAGHALGFSQIAVAPVDLSSAEPALLSWLEKNFHGEMDYMARHGPKRARPAELVPGTVSVITARMNYLPRDTPQDWQEVEWGRLNNPTEAVVSVYARGRDYHKVLRHRLGQLAQEIENYLAGQEDSLQTRAFTDSAPVLEAELATEPVSDHCGQCTACIDVCPTKAIVAPGLVDARRCISYLTIEHAGSIPEELRPLMGNRIYGCDDCQLICPWNKYARKSNLPDFDARNGLVGQQLVEVLGWTEEEFLQRTEGSAIRRIGYLRWLRNVAVAAGNALRSIKTTLSADDLTALRQALQLHANHQDAIVCEHVRWALLHGT
jgi:epoxyqueuosine reductase